MKLLVSLGLAVAGGTIFGGLVYVAPPSLLRRDHWKPGARLVGRYLGERSDLELYEDGEYLLRGTRTEAGSWSESGGQLRLRSEAGEQRLLLVEESPGPRLVEEGESFVSLKSLDVFHSRGPYPLSGYGD